MAQSYRDHRENLCLGGMEGSGKGVHPTTTEVPFRAVYISRDDHVGPCT